MSNELYYQRQILVDAKAVDPDAFAIKMAHKFISGIPDLMIKMPGHDVIYVEVKKGVMTKTGTIKVDTTPIQRATMLKMEKSGIRCEVWVVIDKGYNGSWPTMVRVPPDVTSVQVEDPSKLPARVRGTAWPIKDFLENPVKKAK